MSRKMVSSCAIYFQVTIDLLKSNFYRCGKYVFFSFDANVLLNVYRYTPKTCEELFHVFENLKERTWLTHQAVLEYHERREEVIAQQYAIYEDIEIPLKKASEDIANKYRRRGHSFAATDLLLQMIDETISSIRSTLEVAQSKHPDRREHDDLLNRVTDLFSNRIGNRFSPKQIDELRQEAALRYKLQIPPGYKDKDKGEQRQYGDYILWKQLIDFAKTQKKPIILATDDTKEDWWRIEKGKTIGPRPELIEEMRSKAGAAFYMYNVGEFMRYAKEYLGIRIGQKAIDEAVEIGKKQEVNVEIQRVRVRCHECGKDTEVTVRFQKNPNQNIVVESFIFPCAYCDHRNRIDFPSGGLAVDVLGFKAV